MDGWRAARQRRSVCATRPTPAAAEGHGVLPGAGLAWATDARLRGNGCACPTFESHHNCKLEVAPNAPNRPMNRPERATSACAQSAGKRARCRSPVKAWAGSNCPFLRVISRNYGELPQFSHNEGIPITKELPQENAQLGSNEELREITRNSDY